MQSYGRFLSKWGLDEKIWFVNIYGPWCSRGTTSPNGSDTGVFAYGYTHGKTNPLGSFRVVPLLL